MITTSARVLVAVASSLSWTCAGFAAERGPAFPWKPIRTIVPFAPGGGADLLGRLVSPRLTERLGQPIVIDNRPAAAGIVGADLAAKAAPDGHTLLIATSSHAGSPAMHKKLPYDIGRDLVPITLAANSPLAVLAHPALPVTSVKELIAYARANPTKLNYGSSGAGGPPHIAGEMLKSMAKIEITHVVYKGVGPAMAAVLGNEVQLTFANLFVAQPHVKAGRLRALGVTSRQRSQISPEWPTVAESGLPGYEAGIWFGFMAPAGTPKATIARLHNDITSVLQVAEVKQALTAQGGDVIASTPEEFGKVLRDDIQRLGKVMREAGIKPE